MPGSSRRATDTRPGPGPQRGQSVLELAVALPVLVVLLFGTFNVGVLIVDRVVVAYAARQGARLAAGLGNGQTAGLTTLQVDQDICQTVLASTANLVYASVTEIDIYQADATGAASDGSFSSTVNPYDSYDASCNQLSQTFPASSRGQTPPTEVSIGVRIKWQYATPAGYQALTAVLTDYSVMKATPVLS